MSSTQIDIKPSYCYPEIVSLPHNEDQKKIYSNRYYKLFKQPHNSQTAALACVLITLGAVGSVYLTYNARQLGLNIIDKYEYVVSAAFVAFAGCYGCCLITALFFKAINHDDDDESTPLLNE